MLGAAPKHRCRLAGVFALAVLVLLPGGALAHTMPLDHAAQPAKHLWAVELTGKSSQTLSLPAFRTLADAGINAIVTSRSSWTKQRHKQLVKLTRAARLRLIEPSPLPKTAAARAALGKACRMAVEAADTCAVAAPDAGAAATWIRRDQVRYVLLHVPSLASFKQLRPVPAKKTRLIAIVKLPAGAVDSAWDDAVAAAADGGPDLAVATAEGMAGGGMTSYLSLLKNSSKGGSKQVAGAPAPPADTVPPSAPTNLALTANGQDYLTFVWSGSTDDVGVTGYEYFLNGRSSGTTQATTATISGLRCGTTFEIGLEAVDGAGNHSSRTTILAPTQYGCFIPGGGGGGGGNAADIAPPTAPAAVTTSFVSQSAVTLQWLASSDDTAVTGYGLYAGGVRIGTTTQTSYAFGGLTCGTAYTLGADAYDAAGNRSTVSSAIVSTSPCSDTSAPSTPTNLHQTSSTTTTISIAWTASTDNVAVTGYRVFVDGIAAGTPSGASYTAGGFACGTSHLISVDARDAAGNHSAQATATMAAAACPPPPPSGDTQAPTTPTALAVSAATTTTITVVWTASTDNVGVSGYGVYRNGTLVASPVTTAFTMTGLVCGTSYTLAVDATDAAANRSGRATLTTSTSACPDTQAPTVPAGLALSTRTATSISITWSASTDNVAVAGYDLYVAGSKVGTATTTSYTFTGLACGTSYTLGVVAFDAALNRSTQASVSLGTSACPDTTAPSAPTGVVLGSVTQTSAGASWNASTDNVAVTGYTVYLNGTSTATTAAGTRAYTLSSLTCGTAYTVAVDAFDAAGNHSTRSSVALNTAACSGGGGGGATANLWVDANGGSCARSATPGAYVDAQACGSFNAAYQAAQPGDLVLVQSGGYGAPDLVRKSSASAPNVVIQTAPGASVSFTDLNTGNPGSNVAGADYWSLVGPMTGRTASIQLASHIVLDGITLNGQNVNDNIMYVTAANDVTLRNMDICCNLDQKLILMDAYRGPTTNVTVDHTYFHGQQASSTAVHMECIFDNGVVGFTLRRSIFNGCKQTGDMLITQSGPDAPPPSNTLIENNIWYPATNAVGDETAYSIQSVATGNITIRNNLFLAPMVVSSNGTNYRMSGNIGYQGSCPSGVTYSHNIWVDAKCSSSDVLNSGILNAGFYLGSASNNWHYSLTNPAINAGDPASYPTNDLDGVTRPTGATPDAGPYEAG